MVDSMRSVDGGGTANSIGLIAVAPSACRARRVQGLPASCWAICAS